MKINIYQEEPPVRETRTKSIVGFDGMLKDLTEQGCKGCLKNKDRGFTTGTYCSSAGYAGSGSCPDRMLRRGDDL